MSSNIWLIQVQVVPDESIQQILSPVVPFWTAGIELDLVQKSQCDIRVPLSL